MAERLFEVRALDGRQGGYELTLNGRIYADVAPRLREELGREDLRRLLVDAGALEQIDSAGLGVFVDLLKRVRPDGGRIVFFGLNPNVRRVFQITKLEKVIDVAPDREAALAQVDA